MSATLQRIVYYMRITLHRVICYFALQSGKYDLYLMMMNRSEKKSMTLNLVFLLPGRRGGSVKLDRYVTKWSSPGNFRVDTQM